MGNATKGLWPRTEAGAFPWADLTASQQEAATRACHLLHAMAKDPWEETPKRPDGVAGLAPRIDLRRESRVVLLDGGRGTGKTSVLLSLLEAWKRQLEPRQAGAADHDLLLPAELESSLGVVPIGLVDLEALSPSASLLLQIVGQFQRVVDFLDSDPREMHSGGNPGERPPWDSLPLESTVRKAWRQFLSAATLGGAEGLIGRRALLDPEAFIAEMTQAELHRMDIRSCFRNLMDAVTREVRARRLLPGGQWPLFVLAVDDADMSMTFAVPLLQLLRELWHGRLVFLVTGDSRLFSQWLREESRRGFEHLWRHRDASERIQASWELRDVENQLVDQRFRKVVPPNHRLLLPPLPGDERLRLLAGSLAEIPAPEHPLGLANFAEYCDVVPQVAEILPDNLREIQDLRQWIADRGERHRDRIPGDLVWGLTLHPRDYASVGPPTPKQRVTELAAQVAKLGGQPRKRWAPQDRTKELLRVEGGCAVLMPENGHVDVVAEKDLQQLYDSGNLWLPAVDVLYSGEEDLIQAYVPALPAAVTTAWDAHHYPWPLPDWRSPTDYNAFLHLLSRLIRSQGVSAEPQSARESTTPPLTIDLVLRAYITAVFEYDKLRSERSARPDDAPRLASALDAIVARYRTELPNWEDLAKRARDHWEALGFGTKNEVMREWLYRGLGLLACPEIAVQPRVSDEWLRALNRSFGRDRWETLKGALMRARRELRSTALGEARIRLSSSRRPEGPFSGATPASDSEPEPELRPFERTAASGFLWSDLVGESPSGDEAEVLARFCQRLDDFGVQRVEVHGLFNVPDSLRRYLREEQLPSLIKHTASLEQWLADVQGMASGTLETSYAVQAFWGQARVADPEMPPGPIEFTPTSMLDIRNAVGADASSWHFQPSEDPEQLPPRVLSYDGTFQWNRVPRLRTHLARCAFDLAWDYAIDSCDGQPMPTRAPTGDLRWWRAGGGMEGNMFFPWPAVDWWAHVDHVLVLEAWSRRTRTIASFLGRLSLATRFGDDLAHWYLRVVDKVADERMDAARERNLWRPNAGGDEWRAEVDRIRGHERNHDKSARWGCYREWLKRAPLLAAPESGLSQDAAKWILDAFNPKGDDRELLRRERIRRITEVRGGTEDEAIATLTTIDERYQDHPWAGVVGLSG